MKRILRLYVPMNPDEDVDWIAAFRGYISRESLADPCNPEPHVFISTMMLVEAGLLEFDDQVVGRSSVRKNGLSWASITRNTVVDRVQRLHEDLIEKQVKRQSRRPLERQEGKQPKGRFDDIPVEVLKQVKVGEGAFKDRWEGDGGMARYHMCVIRYVCLDARWRRALNRGPDQAMKALAQIQRGERSLAGLIAEIATQDLKLWGIRLARCWLFPLSLTLDPLKKDVGNRAYSELLDFYVRIWTPVYEQGLAQFGARLRPGVDAAELSEMVSAHVSGFALRIVANGYTDREAERFARSVHALIYAAIDPGDGEPCGRALDQRLR